MVNIGLLRWPNACNAKNGTSGNLLVDAANEVAGGMWTITKAGTITRVIFRTGTVTTGATVDVRLETINASGVPSGTLWGTNTNVSHVIAATDDNLWLRTGVLTGSATVAMGDQIGVLVVNPSSSFGNFNIATTTWMMSLPLGYPCMVNPTRVKVVASQLPKMALEYDDGTFSSSIGTIVTEDSGTEIIIDTTTNPDEIGNYFTAPFKMRVVGWWGAVGPRVNGDYRISLYDVTSGSNTPVLTRDYDGDNSATSSDAINEMFTSAYTLQAGNIYRLAVLPLTANDVGVRTFTVPSAYPNLLADYPGGTGMQYTTRDRSSTTDPDSAAWTETANQRW